MTSTTHDPHRFTTIAHHNHRYLSPLSESKALTLLQNLTNELCETDVVLDAGCGRAALLRDVLKLSRANGVGVDINPNFIDDAHRTLASDPSNDGRFSLLNCPLLDHRRPAHGYAAIICVGSTHAFGSFDECLRVSFEWLKPGGRLLIADGYWKQPPPAAYLDVLGGSEDEFSSHADNACRARDRGYALLRTATSSDDEWDQYEGEYCNAMMHYVATHPDDADAEQFAARMQRWHSAYLEWGRATLGFGYYLLRRI